MAPVQPDELARYSIHPEMKDRVLCGYKDNRAVWQVPASILATARARPSFYHDGDPKPVNINLIEPWVDGLDPESFGFGKPRTQKRAEQAAYVRDIVNSLRLQEEEAEEEEAGRKLRYPRSLNTTTAATSSPYASSPYATASSKAPMRLVLKTRAQLANTAQNTQNNTVPPEVLTQTASEYVDLINQSNNEFPSEPLSASQPPSALDIHYSDFPQLPAQYNNDNNAPQPIHGAVDPNLMDLTDDFGAAAVGPAPDADQVAHKINELLLAWKQAVTMPEATEEDRVAMANHVWSSVATTERILGEMRGRIEKREWEEQADQINREH